MEFHSPNRGDRILNIECQYRLSNDNPPCALCSTTEKEDRRSFFYRECQTDLV